MLQQILTRYLRVPPEPALPPGSAESTQTFRAARGFLKYRFIQWGLKQLGAVTGLIAGLAFVDYIPTVRIMGTIEINWLGDILEIFGICAFLIQLPFTILLVKLDYEMRWYIVTDRSLRIREGILRIREQTMTFSNIQNISIHQGPIQRLFGIEDLRVRTAGGGESAEEGDSEHGAQNMHLGYFRGVSGAAAIRDAILEKLRSSRGTGLGEPVREIEFRAPRYADDPEVLEPARILRDEARRLCETLRRAVDSGFGLP